MSSSDRHKSSWDKETRDRAKREGKGLFRLCSAKSTGDRIECSGARSDEDLEKLNWAMVWFFTHPETFPNLKEQFRELHPTKAKEEGGAS